LRVNASVRSARQSKLDQDAVIIDDDPDTRRLLGACLRRLGFRVHEAATAAEGRILLDRGTPDLICLDVRLPDANGLLVCEQIRASSRLRDVPVMVITALNRPIDRAQAEVAGADEYVTKPFRTGALADSVRELVALSSVAPS
jgi:two-component system OmpR family response regulator